MSRLSPRGVLWQGRLFSFFVFCPTAVRTAFPLAFCPDSQSEDWWWCWKAVAKLYLRGKTDPEAVVGGKLLRPSLEDKGGTNEQEVAVAKNFFSGMDTEAALFKD